jgi:hypothetical protein
MVDYGTRSLVGIGFVAQGGATQDGRVAPPVLVFSRSFRLEIRKQTLAFPSNR